MGEAFQVLDAKGRLTVPALYRGALQAIDPAQANQIVVMPHPHGALMIYPAASFESLGEQLANLSLDAASIRRRLLGRAQLIEIDAGSRIVIPPELRRHAGLTDEKREVCLKGVGRYIEVWERGAAEAQEIADAAVPLPAAVLSVSGL